MSYTNTIQAGKIAEDELVALVQQIEVIMHREVRSADGSVQAELGGCHEIECESA